MKGTCQSEAMLSTARNLLAPRDGGELNRLRVPIANSVCLSEKGSLPPQLAIIRSTPTVHFSRCYVYTGHMNDVIY